MFRIEFPLRLLQEISPNCSVGLDGKMPCATGYLCFKYLDLLGKSQNFCIFFLKKVMVQSFRRACSFHPNFLWLIYAFLQPKKHLSKRTWEFVEKISLDQNVGGTLQKLWPIGCGYRMAMEQIHGFNRKYIFSQGPFTISMGPPPPGLLVKAKLYHWKKKLKNSKLTTCIE